MNRNTNSRFSIAPSLDIKRSRMTVDPEFKATFNIGRLYPLGKPWEVLPGDTWEVDTSFAMRMQPMVCSPMDNLHADIYFFFVPTRLTFDKFRELLGENTAGAWYPQTEYNFPLITFRKFAPKRSIADYMGLPVYDSSYISGDNANKAYSVDRHIFNGYVQIWNEWFRDENLQDPCYVDLSDTDIVSHFTGDETTPQNLNLGISYAYQGCTYPLRVNKTHDMFTSCLPSPQKGETVDLFNHAHVYFGSASLFTAKDMLDKYGAHNVRYAYDDGTPDVPIISVLDDTNLYDVTNDMPAPPGQPLNMYVDSEFTVNELRTAFAMQRMLEKEALFGSRYTELIKGHYGITPADASIQRPQYLGGFRKSLHTNQILQTSETGTTPQGNVAGYSLTGASHDGHWIHSFDEFGYIYPLVCFRIDEHSYQNGIDKMWIRRSKYDIYFPTFANLGNMPVENTEIFTTGFDFNAISKPKDDFISGKDHEVFGYQEAWYDYRYIKNQIAGEMRSCYSTSLDSWHFADDYSSCPSLSASWMYETPSNVDRALAVKSNVSDQLFGDFKFHIRYTRPMPMYSIPGLLDHN